MKIEKCTKNAFVVIGKEGSTLDGQGFIQKLWSDANSHFNEIQPLAKKDENGNLVGINGKITLAKDYTLLVLNAWMMPKHPRDGRNGSSQAMNIFV